MTPSAWNRERFHASQGCASSPRRMNTTDPIVWFLVVVGGCVNTEAQETKEGCLHDCTLRHLSCRECADLDGRPRCRRVALRDTYCGVMDRFCTGRCPDE